MGLIWERVWIDPSFVSAAKDVVGVTNSFDGKFRDEETFMLLVDGKGVTQFKNNVVEVAGDT